MNIILFNDCELASPIRRNDPRSRHIRRILKSVEGDVLKVGLINGNRGTGRITSLTQDEIHLLILLDKSPIPLHPIRIICGLPRPQQAKRILRDCASMGVSHIWFTPTELGEKSYRYSPLWETDAWYHCVREGVEQSGNTLFPDVQIMKNLETVFNCLPDDVQPIILDVTSDAAQPVVGTHPVFQCDCAIVIGSERGWTDAERQFFQARNFPHLNLGQRIFRTDTACIAATALALSSQISIESF